MNQGEPTSNDRPTFRAHAQIMRGGTASDEGQSETRPLPRAFELIGAPLEMSDRSRAYLVSLPPDGTTQFARELEVSIDAGDLPVTNVVFVVATDPEEGTDELVARLTVEMAPGPAIAQWERLEERLQSGRDNLSAESRLIMRRQFSVELRWPE